jgi:leucyl aminopeptidase (aminopeptidase T)
MENVGGTYPVGEVFSEPKDLSQVNGEALVFGYPNPQRYVTIAERPFKITINQGILTDYDSNAPADFVEVLSMIRDIEGVAMIREFGVGLNAAMSRSRHVNDVRDFLVAIDVLRLNPFSLVVQVTAFERQLGLHVSVGKKHNVFKKQGLTGKKAKFHIDLFLDIDKIDIDGKPVFANNAFVV